MSERTTNPVSHHRSRALDALRGVAIALVLLRHAAPDVFDAAGIVGVTIFFTLSGYLITGVLQRDIARNGRVSYSRFYRNRALRLLPALFTFLVGFVVIALAFYPLEQQSRIVTTVLAGLFYVANVPGVPMAIGTTHLWSLAVEEQFYLVWPVLLLLAMRRGRALQLVAACLICWLVVCSTLAWVAREDPAALYELPTSWAVTMLLGAGLRLLSRLPEPRRASVWSAAAILGALCFVPDAKHHVATYLLLGPAVAVLTCVLISAAECQPGLPRPMAPLTWLGTISYAAYLWNLLLVVGLELAFRTWWAPLAGTIATLVVATGSWWLVERPVLRWKERLDAREAVRRTRAAALAQSGDELREPVAQGSLPR